MIASMPLSAASRPSGKEALEHALHLRGFARPLDEIPGARMEYSSGR
jgi:hypothetical protein